MVSTNAPILRRLAPSYPDHLGVFVTPRNGQTPTLPGRLGLPWAADNDAFNGFDEQRYLSMVDRWQGVPGCRFLTVPDVVGDHGATLSTWRDWQYRLRKVDLPKAFVLQDGCTLAEVPWGQLGAVFVGGSTDWKMGRDAAELVREAKRRGAWVHAGRVNSFRRALHFHALGADSIDGTNVCRWPDRWMPRFAAYLAGLDRQPSLFAPH